jgi:hypothetical protein
VERIQSFKKIKQNSMNKIFIAIITLSLAAFSAKSQTITRLQTSSSAIRAASSMSSVTNTTVETTVYGDTIKAGQMATYKEVNLELMFSMTTILTPPTMTVRVKFGGQTLVVVNGLTTNINVTNGVFRIYVKISNKGSAASQYAYGLVQQHLTAGPLSLTSPIYDSQGDWTVDTSVDQPISITVQMGTAISTTTLTPKYIRLKIE